MQSLSGYAAKELMEEVDVDGDITFEEWLRKLMETMEADRAFYKKLANEIEWKQMADRTKAIVAEQVERFLSASGEMKGSAVKNGRLW